MDSVQRIFNTTYDVCVNRLIIAMKTTRTLFMSFDVVEINSEAKTIVCIISELGIHICSVRLSLFQLNETATVVTANFFDWGLRVWDTSINHARVRKIVNKLFDNIS